MSVKTEDTKPLVTVDGHDVFNVPVEEEELDVAPSHGQSKIWAMKVLPLSRLTRGLQLTLDSPLPSRALGAGQGGGCASRELDHRQLVSWRGWTENVDWD